MVFSSTPKRQRGAGAAAVAPPRDRDGPILFRNPAYRAGRESQADARGINNGRPGGLTLRALEKYQGAKVAPCWVSRKEEEREEGLQGNVHQSRLRSSELFQNHDYLFLRQFPDIIWARISAFFGQAKKCRLRGPNYIGETDAGNMSFYS